jgi:hypothetical protein
VYLPGGASNSNINSHLKSDIKILTKNKNVFIYEDWNTRHRLWNCSRANRAGTIIYLNSNNMIIHHPSSHTYFPSDRNKNPSTIDLSITNSSLEIT